MNINTSKITSIDFDKAKEFWDYLSPENPMFSSSENFIYRGHSEASWGLVPSLLRKLKNGKVLHPIRLYPCHEYNLRDSGDNELLEDIASNEIIFTENQFLNRFVEYCDKAGISIPSDNLELRNTLDYTKGEIDKFFMKPTLWPNNKFNELMAFAQHYELPTRLLDWSYRSHVAIYFAASGALSKFDSWKQNKDMRLAVWILDKSKIGELKDIEIIKVPSSVNSNVAAQAGCFTLLRQKAQMFQPFEGTCDLEKYIAPQHNANDILKKVTVPMNQSIRLLELCELYGVSAATIFPDAYGAAKAAVDNVERFVIRDIEREKANS